jgi:hypothetical protein
MRQIASVVKWNTPDMHKMLVINGIVNSFNSAMWAELVGKLDQNWDLRLRQHVQEMAPPPPPPSDGQLGPEGELPVPPPPPPHEPDASTGPRPKARPTCTSSSSTADWASAWEIVSGLLPAARLGIAIRRPSHSRFLSGVATSRRRANNMFDQGHTIPSIIRVLSRFSRRHLLSPVCLTPAFATVPGPQSTRVARAGS